MGNAKGGLPRHLRPLAIAALCPALIWQLRNSPANYRPSTP